MAFLRGIYKLWFTKGNDMSKCKLVLGGMTLIAETETAMKMFDMLNELEVERLDYDYISKSDSPTGESQTLHYLKDFRDYVKLEGLDPKDYAMWKLYTSSRGEKK